MKQRLLTLDEALDRFHAAGLTDLDRTWIRNQVDRGLLPAVVVARRRRVRMDVVDRMIEDWMKKAA
ncbi:hypothetical protein [Microcystis phage Mwe-JY26]